MSLRFGSGWLVTYFLICSCTFKCSAPQLRARYYTTFNLFEPLPFSVTPDTRFWVAFSPLQGRAALTVEVTRPRGRPASRCCVGAFQNSQRLEMCGAPRSGQRGWSTCTPSRVHIPDVLSATLPLQDWGRVARHSHSGLELHADKTRLIEFGRFAARDRKYRGEGKPETFTFLGFTHFCGQL